MKHNPRMSASERKKEALCCALMQAVIAVRSLSLLKFYRNIFSKPMKMLTIRSVEGGAATTGSAVVGYLWMELD